jgi:hypothetical protein
MNRGNKDRAKARAAAAVRHDAPHPQVDDFRGRHLALAQQQIETEFGRVSVTVDEGESSLAWLTRRRGRDGRALVAPHQLQAGERLRIEFTRAHLMPRTTSSWESAISSGRRRGGGDQAASVTEVMVTARQRVHGALDAVGPEFAGLLLDVCCFLKRLEEIERERAWPARSAKVVLQLALERLARHYGYAGETRGRARSRVQTWLTDGAGFSVDGT